MIIDQSTEVAESPHSQHSSVLFFLPLEVATAGMNDQSTEKVEVTVDFILKNRPEAQQEIKLRGSRVPFGKLVGTNVSITLLYPSDKKNSVQQEVWMIRAQKWPRAS